MNRDGSSSLPLLTTVIKQLVKAIRSNDVITRISLGSLPDVLRQKCVSIKRNQEHFQKTLGHIPGLSSQINKSPFGPSPIGPNDSRNPILISPMDPLLADIYGALEAIHSIKDVLDLSSEWIDWMFDYQMKQKIETAESVTAARLYELKLANKNRQEEQTLDIVPTSPFSLDKIQVLLNDNKNHYNYNNDDNVQIDDMYDYSPSGRKREEEWDTTWATSFDYMSPRKMIQKLELFQNIAERSIGLTSPISGLRKNSMNNINNSDNNMNNSNTSDNNQNSSNNNNDSNNNNNHSNSYNRNQGLDFVYDHNSTNKISNARNTYRKYDPQSHVNDDFSASILNNTSTALTNEVKKIPSFCSDDVPFSPSNCSVFMTELPDDMSMSIAGDANLNLNMKFELGEMADNYILKERGEQDGSERGRGRTEINDYGRKGKGEEISQKNFQPSFRRERSRERIAQQLQSISRSQSTCTSTDKFNILDKRQSFGEMNWHENTGQRKSLNQLHSEQPVCQVYTYYQLLSFTDSSFSTFIF